MILTDEHVHSDVSQDSHESMYNMMRAEAAYGIESMCFTNHCDMVDWHTYTFRPQCRIVVSESLRKYREMTEAHGTPPIDVRIGIELGEPLFAPDTARSIAQSEGLDFVIGSLHILQQYGDFCTVQYRSLEECYTIFDAYLNELLKVAELDFFDVMAHIGYCRRYMMGQGLDAALTLDRYGDRVEQLLRTLIAHGRGIEINCSGLRDGCGPFPGEEILRLYRSLGGEIITVGSDTHAAAKAAACVREGYDVLRACGFHYYSRFRARRCEMLPL